MIFLKGMAAAMAITFTIGAHAQTVDEIVAKNIAALGGKEKLQTLKTVKMSGSMSVSGTDVIITNIKSHMTGARMDIEVMGTSNYKLNNTSKGWNFMPIFGMSAPVELTPDELKSAVALLDIQSPLLDYKEKGNSIQLKGTEKVDGADAWNLAVTYRNGKLINFFIDTKTGFVIKTTSTENENGQEKLEVLSFGDYKKNEAGYWFPYSVTNDRGTIVYNRIDTNVAADAALFTN